MEMPLCYYLCSCILKAHQWNVVHFNPFSAAHNRAGVHQSIINKALNVQYNKVLHKRSKKVNGLPHTDSLALGN